MIENVRGFLDTVFEDYRAHIRRQLMELGYEVHWRMLNAADYGVPQLRPLVIIVAIRDEYKTNSSGQRSMLNIMLMRALEQPLFEKTKAWLAQSEDNCFTFVVDELHSYRGTQGTEVFSHRPQPAGPSRARTRQSAIALRGHVCIAGGR